MCYHRALEMVDSPISETEEVDLKYAEKNKRFLLLVNISLYKY